MGARHGWVQAAEHQRCGGGLRGLGLPRLMMTLPVQHLQRLLLQLRLLLLPLRLLLVLVLLLLPPLPLLQVLVLQLLALLVQSGGEQRLG